MSFLDLKLNNINYQLGVLTAQSGLVNVANTQANSVFYPMFCPTFGNIQPVSINQSGLTYRANTDTLTSTGLISSTLTSTNITAGTITNNAAYNIPATPGSIFTNYLGTTISITITPVLGASFPNGSKVVITGCSNALFNNVPLTVSSFVSNNIVTNNPTSIAANTNADSGQVSGGTITSTDMIAANITSSGAVNALNLNGKLNVVGGTSNSGNVILCNNTTSTTGNFDLLTDSNQHLRFASNLLTIGGATNGGIAIPGTAGSVVCNQYTTNANTKMILNSTETANGIIEYQTSGVKRGVIQYANASYPYQLMSELGLSLDTKNNGDINIACDGTGTVSLIAQGGATRASFSGTSTTIGSTAAQGMTFVNASGNAINFYTSGYNIFQMGTINCAVSHSVAYGAGYDFITFYYNSVAIGSVHQVSSNAITINYSSDYRLKENIQPINDCITVLNKLKPISFNWKNGGEDALGFLAHEFAEVFPNNVVGQKDAVNADGTIKSQQMSDSCCIPLLVSCVQEQNKIIVDMRKELDDLKLLVNSIINKPL